jgi:hypothetical protein
MADVDYAGIVLVNADIALATIAWTLGSWIVLFALMYLVSPFLMK